MGPYSLAWSIRSPHRRTAGVVTFCCVEGRSRWPRLGNGPARPATR